MDMMMRELDPSRAWSRYEPDASTPWTRSRVAHLHRRAGFSAPWSVLERDLAEGHEKSLDRIIEGEATAFDGLSKAEFAAFHDGIGMQLGGTAAPTRLQAIWLYRMIFTPHPLLERMTMFWHNHFATSIAKVKNATLMQRQNALFRAHALGDFKTLLAEIGQDPAMLIWLDSTENKKAKPNENYAREVMELFSLGRGHYSEKDIQEAARAFTGWFVVRNKFNVVPAQHDSGEKTILGQTGPFSGEDLPKILLEQRPCASFIARKLFKQFISDIDEPTDTLLEPIAEAFRKSDYDVKVPLRMILGSKLFYADTTIRQRVKSPVEYVVGMIRSLEILRPTLSSDKIAQSCDEMGQALFEPPSVAGWDGGSAWINTTAMLARTNMVLHIVDESKKFDAAKFAEAHKATDPAAVARFYVDLLVQDGFDPKLVERITAASLRSKDPREVVRLILTAPEYQLA